MFIEDSNSLYETDILRLISNNSKLIKDNIFTASYLFDYKTKQISAIKYSNQILNMNKIRSISLF